MRYGQGQRKQRPCKSERQRPGWRFRYVELNPTESRKALHHLKDSVNTYVLAHSRRLLPSNPQKVYYRSNNDQGGCKVNLFALTRGEHRCIVRCVSSLLPQVLAKKCPLRFTCGPLCSHVTVLNHSRLPVVFNLNIGAKAAKTNTERARIYIDQRLVYL